MGYENFSVLGWSEGAKVALVMAVNHPNCIKSIIMCGIITFPTEKNIKNILSTKNIDDWGREMINNYLRAYKDCDEIQELWDKQLKFIANFGKYFPNGICNNKLNGIKCPVLIIHGDRV